MFESPAPSESLYEFYDTRAKLSIAKLEKIEFFPNIKRGILSFPNARLAPLGGAGSHAAHLFAYKHAACRYRLAVCRIMIRNIMSER